MSILDTISTFLSLAMFLLGGLIVAVVVVAGAIIFNALSQLLSRRRRTRDIYGPRRTGK